MSILPISRVGDYIRTDSRETQRPQSSSSTSASPTTTNTLLDLLEFRRFLYPTLQHPIEAVQAFFPQDYLPTMFGGKSFTPETDIPDLSGRVYLVTGGWISALIVQHKLVHHAMLMSVAGNTGLGKETVLQLAKHNPSQIYLAARTPSKAEAAIAEIKAAVPSADIKFLNLDLTSFTSIADAARQFTSESQRLDVLVNNAGVMALPPDTTKDGYEIQFGTNHVGHALLTKLLMPTLLATAKQPGSDVRIVNLSSEGHNLAPSGGVTWDKAKLEALGPWGRYGNSKLANVLFARELAAKHPTITSVSVHPGLIATDLYGPNKATSTLMRYGMALLQPLMFSSVEQGTRNQLWAATAPKDQLKSGAYYKPVGSLSSGSGHAQNGKMAESLWEWTEKELASKGY
ncbi:hypothetical protein MMC30_007592 [Trapelia coarctata]|nr:hypothetical protein [Trapelia coarctata]